MRITIDADILMVTITATVLLTFVVANSSAMLRLGIAVQTMHQCEVLSVLLEHYANEYNSWVATLLDAIIYRALPLITIAGGAIMVLKFCRQKTTTNRQIANSIELELQQVARIIREDARFEPHFLDGEQLKPCVSNGPGGVAKRKAASHSSTTGNVQFARGSNKRFRTTGQPRAFVPGTPGGMRGGIDINDRRRAAHTHTHTHAHADTHAHTHYT